MTFSPDGTTRDLDVGVMFERGALVDHLALLSDLHAMTGVEVDLAHLNRAGPVLRERALVGSVGLFESEAGALATAASAAIGERIDTDPMRRLDLELLAEGRRERSTGARCDPS